MCLPGNVTCSAGYWPHYGALGALQLRCTVAVLLARAARSVVIVPVLAVLLPVHLAVQCRLSHCTGLSFTGAPADDARNRQFDNPFVDCLLLPVNSTYPNRIVVDISL